MGRIWRQSTATARRRPTAHVGGYLGTRGRGGPRLYVIDDGEPEMVRKLGDGGKELRKVATADYYVGGLGTLSRFPLSDRAARADATLMGYPPQAFRQGMLGPAGVRDVIEHRKLPTAKPAR